MDLNPYAALAELCKRSFYRFLMEFWDVVIPEDPVWNWHIKYLCDELQYLNSFVEKREPKPYDLVINISPGSTKSTIVEQMYNAWVWTRDPAQRFISTSYAHALALSHSIKTRDIVLSEKYQLLFPGVTLKKDQSGKGDFRNNTGGQRFTTSTGGTVLGMHGHQIIVGDPINPKQAASKVERENANEFVTTTLSTRKVDKDMTPIILIMQRLHEDDPSGRMLEKSNKVKHICLPAELAPNVSPIELRDRYVNGLMDPVRLNQAVLEDALETLGSYGYAGQYGQNPAPPGGGLIKEEWFDIIEWAPEYANLVWHFVADTAYTSDEKNDPSGYLAYAKVGANYIIRAAKTEHLEFPELLKALPRFVRLNGYGKRSLVEIEPKASGKSLVQTIRKETSLNAIEGKPPAKDKITRVNDSSPTMEAHRVRLIKGAWNKPFLDQLTTFPNAKHDEYVDCVTMMIGKTKRAKKGVGRAN
jgi:predicted phage terminase large subunit-like protein